MEKSDEQQISKKFINVTYLSGLVSGAINKFITHPIDTVKAKINVRLLGCH